MRIALTLVFYLAFSGVAVAFGGGPDDGGEGGGDWGSGDYGDACGSCVVILPEVLQKSAGPLEKSFRNTDIAKLLGQKYDRVLCEEHPCGEFTEDVAADFLGDMIAHFQREEDQSLAKWGMYTGIGGLFLAIISIVQSTLSRRKTRRADERSIRNEARLQGIKGNQSQ